jgi:RimJ/RimL family protein N-acetyltransferase
MSSFTTSRLVLRKPAGADVEPMAEMNADPEVMRYIGDGSVLPVDRGRAALAVPNFLPQILQAVEIGWRLPRSQWGRGYATEAVRVVLRFGFEECGLDRVVSIRHVGNVRSKRVMDKLGLRFESETTVPAHGAPVAVHAITRAEHTAA